MSEAQANGGSQDQMMEREILSIRLCQESKRWDQMVDKIDLYLQSNQNVYRERKADQKQVNADQRAQKAKGLEDEQAIAMGDLLEEQKDAYGNPPLKQFSNRCSNAEQDEEEIRKRFEELQENSQEKVFEADIKCLIASAFKSQLGEIRDSLKNVSVLHTRINDDSKSDMLNDYKDGLKKDLVTKAQRLIKIIDDYCLPSAALHGAIYFLKIQADFYRYMADASTCEEKDGHVLNAETKYNEARGINKLRIQDINQRNADEKADADGNTKQYPVIDEIRLGLCLNYAVFLYDVKTQKKEALRILKQEIQEALEDYDKWDDKEMDNIKQQISLIQENINLWKDEVQDDDSDE